MLNFKEGLFIGAIGIATLFSSGCEMTDKFVTVQEGVSYQEEKITGKVVQVFPFTNELKLHVEGYDELVIVVLKDDYRNEIDSWKNEKKTFSGRLEGNSLTYAELEN